jgi:glycosyltransferase involved in cell wall biosynthesis
VIRAGTETGGADPSPAAPNPGRLRVTLLGFTVPDASMARILAEDPAMPIQTHSFAWGVVNALRAAGCDVSLLSTLPVSTYPRSRRVLVRGGKDDIEGTPARLLGFANVVVLRQCTRFLGACLRGLPALRSWRTQVLLVHGVHTPFLYFGAFAARCLGIAVVPILTDPPGVPQPHDGRLIATLRRIDIALVRYALRHASGVVTVTLPLARDFAPDKRALVVEGIYTDPTAAPPGPAMNRQLSGDAATSGPFAVAYAGGLSRSYGVDRLVEAVTTSDNPRLRLLLYGRGELQPWIAERAAADPRIRPVRFLDRTELAAELRRADLLVNPRPLGQDFVRYSFPSKLLDYMSSGRAVLTTRLPGIPASYADHLLFTDSDTVEAIQRGIESVMAMPPAERGAVAAAGAAFVAQSAGVGAQGRRIVAFLRPLAGIQSEVA